MVKKQVVLISILLVALSAMAYGQEDSSRPKIGLVLGGGGALGISPVGVLRVLEEQYVPFLGSSHVIISIRLLGEQ